MSKWLDDDYLVKRGRATDWKKQYKLRHNWSKGSCKVSETEVAKEQLALSILVRFHKGIIVTVDSTAGLRAWQTRGDQRLIAKISLTSGEIDALNFPTSLAIDSLGVGIDGIRVAVGFTHGGFNIYQLLKDDRTFIHLYTHASSSKDAISAIAYASPYILTMNSNQFLSLYYFDLEGGKDGQNSLRMKPRMLSSLKSHTTWSPVSLAIRSSPTGIFASIAYFLPTYLAGWSIGIQELRLSLDGKILKSRLASALNQGFAPISEWQFPRPNSRASWPYQRMKDFSIGLLSSKPTSLSYTHPYLLSTHQDNTLMAYMVTSNDSDLSIGTGYRLWGHASSVSGGHIGDRGKAVSVSTHGHELRLWELEGKIAFKSSKLSVAASDASIQVQPEPNPARENDANHSNSSKLNRPYIGLINRLGADEAGITNEWVGFDEEKVVVLRRKNHGTQSLVIYDFT